MESTNSIGRRTVLRRAAAVGLSGLASIGATGGTATATNTVTPFTPSLNRTDVLTALHEYDVVLDRSVLEISAEMRNGQQLLETLANDGLISGTLADVANSGDEYGIRKNDGVEIGFDVPVEKGRLQITFTETAPPFAAYYPDDRSVVVHYLATVDGEGYKTSVQQIKNEASSGISTDCDSICGGCTCDLTICWLSYRREACQVCTGAECRTVSDCGC